MVEENQNSKKDKIIRNWQITSMALVMIFTFFVAVDRGFLFSSLPKELEEKSFTQEKEQKTLGEESFVQKQKVLKEERAGNLVSIIPTGIPAVYGETLGISYDSISPYNPRQADGTIAVMANIDKTTELSGKDLERYIDILHNQHDGMSCEFCCGARAIIFKNGEMACGCAHSYAMRGIAKYLILNSDMDDQEILSEVGKWKVLFFPGIHEQKALVMEEQNIEVNYVSLTVNENRGIKAGAKPGSMVGGC